MLATAQPPTTDLERRLRAALSQLARSGGSRCSEGPFDVATYDSSQMLRTG